MTEVTAAAPNQKTKVAEISDVVETIRNISVDIRGKSFELTSSPSTKEEIDKEVATENVGNAMLTSLHGIKGILREAYETLAAFV